MIWDVHPESIRIQSLKGTGSQHLFFVLYFVSIAVFIPLLSKLHFSKATYYYSIMPFKRES
jgi:hypothetical protein